MEHNANAKCQRLLVLGLCLVVNVLATEKRSHWTRLCGACTMLVLLGVPWSFSAFAVIDASDNSRLERLEGIFNVSFVFRLL